LSLTSDFLQVSGGTVRDLLAGLRSVGECRGLSVLEEALRRRHEDEDEEEEEEEEEEPSGEPTTRGARRPGVRVQTGDSLRRDSPSAGESLARDPKADPRVDSGVELSTA